MVRPRHAVCNLTIQPTFIADTVKETPQEISEDENQAEKEEKKMEEEKMVDAAKEAHRKTQMDKEFKRSYSLGCQP